MTEPTIYIEDFQGSAALFSNHSYPGASVRFRNDSPEEISISFSQESPFEDGGGFAIPPWMAVEKTVRADAFGRYPFSIAAATSVQNLRIDVEQDETPYMSGVRWGESVLDDGSPKTFRAIWQLFVPSGTGQAEVKNTTAKAQTVAGAAEGKTAVGDVAAHSQKTVELTPEAGSVCTFLLVPNGNVFPFTQSGGTRQVELIIE